MGTALVADFQAMAWIYFASCALDSQARAPLCTRPLRRNAGLSEGGWLVHSPGCAPAPGEETGFA